MNREEVLTKIQEISDELPKLPDVIIKLLRIIDDPEVSPVQVVRVLEPDPALVTRILRVANSAYYGFSQTISEIKRAVPLIGLDMVRSLALSLGVLDNFTAEKSQTGYARDQLWLHCLAVGNGANHFAQRMGMKEDHLFITAFLHDVGKLVLDKFFPHEFKICLQEAAVRGVPTYEVEKELLGMDHGEVGALLLEKWQFPTVIVEPVRHHHATTFPEGVSRKDVAIIRIMDALVCHIGFTTDQEPSPLPIYGSDLKVLGLDKDGLSQIKRDLDESSDELTAMFAAMR